VTSLELALVLVAFLWMMMGIFDLARYLVIVQSLVTLMTDAERYAVIDPLDATNYCFGAATWPNTATSAPLLDPNQVNVSICQVTVAGVNQMQVTATYPFAAITPGLEALNGTVTETTIYAW
jgi:hypothetical protein